MTVLTTLILALFFCILPTPSLSDASPPHATIRGRLRLPDPNASLNSTRLTLNDGSLTTYTLPDGSFVFHRVPPGVHLLDVQSREHHFSQVKVQLLEEAMDAPKCVEYMYPGATKQAVPHPLELTAHASYQYYEPRDGFSILGIFKNPMLLMMVVMGGMMFMMPKMMENLDPEQKEQMQRQLEMQQDPTKMLSQMWGEFTGTGSEEQPAPAVERKPSAKAGAKTARRGKRD